MLEGQDFLRGSHLILLSSSLREIGAISPQTYDHLALLVSNFQILALMSKIFAVRCAVGTLDIFVPKLLLLISRDNFVKT